MNMSTKQASRCRNPVVVAMTLPLLTGLPCWSQAQLRIEVRPFESMTMTGDAFLRGEPGKPVVLAGEWRIPKAGTDRLPAVILAHPAC